MTTPIAPLDFSGIIPVEYSTQIIEEAIQQSAVLQLGQRLPMGTSINEMPIPKTFPKAAWVAGPGGRKPYTKLELETFAIHAEEVAAITAIPDPYLEDSSINLWAWVRPRLAEAIAVALDDAVLFGTDAPPTFPAGGLNAVALDVGAGVDAVDTVNKAMSAVEGQGLAVTGSAADLTVRGALRGVRAPDGTLLLGPSDVNTGGLTTLFGAPIAYTPFSQPAPDFFTGQWRNLIIGVRQDIRFNMDPTAVIADEEGKVVISGWQDNVTPLKVWARFGCAIVKVPTVRKPDGADAFAKATITGAGNGGGGEDIGGLSAARQRQAAPAPRAGSGKA